MVEKEVYLRWRDDPCTKELLGDISKTIEELVSRLVTDSNSTEKQDAFFRGSIRALIEIGEWKPDLVEETDEEH